jgi:hypothetical protein
MFAAFMRAATARADGRTPRLPIDLPADRLADRPAELVPPATS